MRHELLHERGSEQKFRDWLNRQCGRKSILWEKCFKRLMVECGEVACLGWGPFEVKPGFRP
jgi:hypothetical protein